MHPQYAATRLSISLLAVAAIASGLTGLRAQKLQVYVLAGQSNMQGHAKVSTFDYIGEDPQTKGLLAEMRDSDGKPSVCDDVWISYLTGAPGSAPVAGKLTAGYGARRNANKSDDKIGPEFTFGLHMAKVHKGPVLLIKAAWGGKSLHTDFRSPSAGPYVFSSQQLTQFEKQGKDIDAIRAERQKATGHFYRLTMDHVKNVLANLEDVCPAYSKHKGYELAGFVWFQGWNDMVDRGVYPQRDQPGGYKQYSECMAHFIRDVRTDLSTPKLPFVIGVMGVGGPIDAGDKRRKVHEHFRAAMAAPAAMAEFRGNVTAVATSPFWDTKLAEIRSRLDKVSHMERMLRTKNKNGPNKDGTMSKDEQRTYIENYRQEVVSSEDLATWQRGASNAGYHYLGCGKTMARIGVAFAEAVLAMQQ